MAKKYYPKSKAVKKVFRHSKINKAKKFKYSRIMPDFEYIESKEAYKCQSTLSERSYKYYSNNTKEKNKLSQVNLHKIFELFLKELRLQMLNNEAGVLVENFGYFGVVKSPKRVITEKTPFPTKDIKTAGTRHIPIFIPIRKMGTLQVFTMDKSFHPSLYNGVKNRIKKHKKYKLAFTLLHNIYGRENKIVNPPILK